MFVKVSADSIGNLPLVSQSCLRKITRLGIYKVNSG